MNGLRRKRHLFMDSYSSYSSRASHSHPFGPFVQAQDTLISETKEARGDRPSANTRSTSTKPATVAVQEGSSNKKEHNKKKEQSWSGGTTHVRSKISERMVELISGLQRKGDG